MNKFLLNKDMKFTIDVNGVYVLNKKDRSHLMLQYPDAAVWSVFIENHDIKKTRHMLQAILGTSEQETKEFIRCCMKHWKQLNIIQ